MKKLAPLIEQTKRVDDELLGRDDSIEKAKRMFVERISTDRRQQRPASPRPRWVLAATAAGFVVAIIGVAFLGYFLGQDTHHETAPVGKWLSAPADRELPINFADGSKIVLAKGAEGRLTEQGLKVVLFLERGGAKFYVANKGKADWRVNAGPYEVRVTGTVFSTSWQPDSTEFLLKVFEGEVEVEGPLAEGGHKVAANHSFSAIVKENKIELALLQELHEDVPEESPAIDENGNKNKVLHKQNTKTATAQRIDQRPQKWIDAAREGRYKIAMERIEKLNLTALLETASSDELFLLGDSARLTRRYAVAEHAYTAVRSRFKGTGHATAAALVLGRMAFDQLGNYNKASSWLRIYLKEGKGSGPNREILGRLMESEHKMGDDDKARVTAGRYLLKYPDGPHSDLAKTLLDQ